eukprot:6462797-Amphidinium_carterae.3
MRVRDDHCGTFVSLTTWDHQLSLSQPNSTRSNRNFEVVEVWEIGRHGFGMLGSRSIGSTSGLQFSRNVPLRFSCLSDITARPQATPAATRTLRVVLAVRVCVLGINCESWRSRPPLLGKYA